MYTITIKNYYVNGTLNKNETVLYTIPIQEDQIENVLTDPSVSCDLGRTGTFEFTVHPNHPYYHAFAQMRTIMRVDYDGDTIFRGRILTIDNTMKGAKKVHCEGDMAFLLDSFQMGSKKETRDEITLNAYINKILNEHNRQMMEEEASSSDGTAISGARISGKEIYPGYIPGAYPDSVTSAQQIENKKDKFGSDSAEQTMNALEALTKEFGGFFRTRYSARDNKTYLDWCKLWFREDTANSQPIAVAQNIIDANSNSEVDNIFTALIPIGSNQGEDVFVTGYRTDIHGDNNRILVPQITKVYSESQLNNGYVTKSIYERAVSQYGIIYKVQKFQNADTQDKLWEYACDWIKNNYVGGITSYDLSAVDMHHVDNHVQKYLAGDCVSLTIHSDMTELDEYNPNKQSNTVRRTLLSVKYDLHHPDKNKYTAGIPSDILNLEYGTASTSKGGKGGAGAKGGGNKKGGDDEKREREAREEAINSLAWKLVWDETYNNEKYKAVKEKHPHWSGMNQPMLDTAQMVVHRVMSDPSIDTPQEVTSVVLQGEKARISLMNPTNEVYRKVAQQSPLAGKYMAKLQKNIDEIDEINTTLALDASLKALSIKGKNSDIIDEAANRLKNVQLPEDATPEDYRKAIESNLAGIDLPKDVFKVGTNKDSAGNEAGLLQMGKEEVTNTQLNAGGNGGKGTADLGKKNGQWLVQVNEPLRYVVDGVTKTIPDGTIDANDLSFLKQAGDPLPSVSAQIATFKTVIAETVNAVQVNANDLKSVHADIDDLEAEFATIDTIVSNRVNAALADASLVQTNQLITTYGTVKNSYITVGTGQASWRNTVVKGSDGTNITLRYLGQVPA